MNMLDQVLNALTILAWVLFILYLLLSMLRGFQAGGVGGAVGSITRWRVLIALFVVIAISLLSASLVNAAAAAGGLNHHLRFSDSNRYGLFTVYILARLHSHYRHLPSPVVR